MDKVRDITGSRELNNVSVMIDYHYCNKDLNIYPTHLQSEVSMIRMTARKDMLDDAITFALKLRDKTNIDVSFNIFNISNYQHDELASLIEKVKALDFSFIYMADTHGFLNLTEQMKNYEGFFKSLKDAGKNTGFHLHNHTGKAYSNYLSCVENPYIDFCDTSVMGLGKGAGNLSLEHVIEKEDAPLLSNFINKYYEQFFKRCASPYYLITGLNSITDNYATEAERKNIDLVDFSNFCKEIEFLEKDNYNKDLLTEYFK
jgi:4-hydroxy 2-oxovalerate aldolase